MGEFNSNSKLIHTHLKMRAQLCSAAVLRLRVQY